MTANDIIEKCAEICDRYALENHEAAVKAGRRASRLLEIDSAQRETAEIGSVECEAAALEAAAIANEIRALKSSLPAETVSDAMVEQARLIIANEIKCNGFVKSSGLCVRGTLEKHCDCREASRQILALAPADDGWRPISKADDIKKNGGEVDLMLMNSAGEWRRATDCHFHCGEWLNWNCDDGDEPRWHNVEGENEGDVIWKVTHFMPLPAPPKNVRG